jgi:methyl-accepting chemotaxis protein
VAASFVPELNMYVIAEVPEAEVLGDVTRSLTISALVGGLVGGGIGMFVVYLVSAAIAAPVARAAQMLGEIADGNGDLSRRMTVESKDEVGALAEGFNRFVASLNTTIRKVRDSTETIATASSEIASGNLDLSARTEAQASSLEETASANGAADGHRHAECRQRAAGQSAGAIGGRHCAEGGAVVGRVVQTMESIKTARARLSTSSA